MEVIILSVLILSFNINDIKGTCPGAVEIDVEKQSGTWYEYSRSKNWLTSGTCVKDEIKSEGQNHLVINSHQLDEEGKGQLVVFTMIRQGKDLKTTSESIPKPVNINILASEEDFSIHGICSSTRINQLIVLTKTKIPDRETEAKIKDIISNYEEKPDMERVKQNC